MPMPESHTRKTTSWSVRSASTSIRPPGGVNFAALCMRLVITWRMRAGSASIIASSATDDILTDN